MRQTLITLFLSSAVLSAQEVTSDPIGFNKVTCLANSDTIVGVPLRKEGSLQTTLSGAPTGTGDSITLPVTATLTAGQFTKHYAKFTSGTKDGSWYDITSNAADSITIDLNGDNLTGVVTGNSVVIAEYWTLESLFPAASATNSASTTGHAIVASNGTGSLSRRTEILIPNHAAPGINRLPGSTHFINGSSSPKAWTRAVTSTTFAPSGDTILIPDGYLVIRHPGSVASSTTFRSLGEVINGKWSIPLFTLTSGKQDNQIALPRPLPLKLSQLNLLGTPAFSASSSASALARKDELLVFNNAEALRNRTPSNTYFVIGTNWMKIVNNIATVANDDQIEAGAGIIVRKAKTIDGATVFWSNVPTY